jgi:hypothetical protein
MLKYSLNYGTRKSDKIDGVFQKNCLNKSRWLKRFALWHQE